VYREVEMIEGIRNRAIAYRRFYEPGGWDTPPTRRRVTALLLVLILGLAVIAVLTTYV
jgi:hypothetical protein